MADERASLEIFLQNAAKLIGDIDGAKNALNELRKAADGLASQKSEFAATKRLQDLTRQSATATTALDRLKNAGQRLNAVFSDLGSTLKGRLGLTALAVALAKGVSELNQFINAAIETKRAFDGIENTLRAAAGSTEAYQRAQSLVIETANRLGLQVTRLGSDYAQLIASTKNLELSQRQIEDVFISVAEAGRVLQLSNQRVQLTFLALSQIASKGIATMEELRRQLGDQLPGVLPGVAKALNLTTAELIDLIREGKVTAEEVLPAIAKAAKELAGGQVRAAAATLAASIERLNTAFEFLKKRVIETNEEALKAYNIALTENVASNEAVESSLAALTGLFVDFKTQLSELAPVAAFLAEGLGRGIHGALSLLLAPLRASVALFTGLRIEFYKLRDSFRGGIGEVDFEPVRIAAEDTFRAIEDVNERLLTAQKKSIEEERKLYEEAAAERKTIAEEIGDELIAIEQLSAEEREKIQLEAAKRTGDRLAEVRIADQKRIGELELEIARANEEEGIDIVRKSGGKRLRLAADLARQKNALAAVSLEEEKKLIEAANRDFVRIEELSAEERKRIAGDILRERRKTLLAEAEIAAGAFDQEVQLARAAGEERLSHSREIAGQLADLEIELGDNVAAALDAALEKTKLNNEQRSEAQKELTEALLDAERKYLDDVAELEQEFYEKLREDGADREKVEQELTEKLLKLQEKYYRERLDLAEDSVEDIRKAEEKRVKDLKKVLKDLLEAEREYQEQVREGREKLRDFLEETVGGAFDLKGDGGADRQSRINELLEERQRLQDELLQGSGDPIALFNQINSVEQALANLNRGLTETGESSRKAGEELLKFGQDTLAGLLDTIDTEGFRAAFDQLSETEQGFARNFIADFAATAQAGRATQQTVIEFSQRMADFGLIGADAAGRVRNAIDELGQPTEAAQKLGELAEKAQELGAGAELATGPLAEIDTSLSGIAASTETAATGLAGVGTALSENQEGIAAAATSLGSLADAMPAIQDAAGSLVESVPSLVEALQAAVEDGTFDSIATSITTILTAAKENADSLEVLRETFQQLLEAGEESETVAHLATAVEDLIASFDERVEAIREAAESLGLLRDAAGEMVGEEGALSRVQAAFEDLATFLTSTFLPKIKEIAGDQGIGAISTALDEVSGDLETQEKAWLDLSVTVVDALSTIREAISGIRSDLAALQVDIESTGAAAAEAFG